MTTTPTNLSDLLLVKLIDCNPVSSSKFETAAYLLGLHGKTLPSELNFQGMRMKVFSIGARFAKYANSGATCQLKVVRNK